MERAEWKEGEIRTALENVPDELSFDLATKIREIVMNSSMNSSLNASRCAFNESWCNAVDDTTSGESLDSGLNQSSVTEKSSLSLNGSDGFFSNSSLGSLNESGVVEGDEENETAVVEKE